MSATLQHRSGLASVMTMKGLHNAPWYH